MTTFEQCCDAAVDCRPLHQMPDGGVVLDHVAVTRAVLTCVLESTTSPRTMDEMDRILAGAPATNPVFVA